MSVTSELSAELIGHDSWEAEILTEDRRSAPRLAKAFKTTLVSPREGDVLCCATRDLSEGGVFIYAPPGCKLAVGQRFEIVLTSGRNTGDFGDGLYATVVRTEVVMQDDRPAVGAGMRFDQPLMF